MNQRIFYICLAAITFIISVPAQEMVYAEMEFPLSFISYLTDYRFNPLDKFQTEVDGRLIELSCDPLVDIYEIASGQQAYRPCLANWRILESSGKRTLNFNLLDVAWTEDRAFSVEDVLFSLEYRHLNKSSWQIANTMTIAAKGMQSFDAFHSDPALEPSPGEFYFPIVNKAAFQNSSDPSKAIPDKTKARQMGFGRYIIGEIAENQYIRLKRRPGHPYFQDLRIPEGHRRLETIRMQAFPKALLNRNEQFSLGRVHLLTSVTPNDRGYILHSAPNTKVSTYSDDSFSGFLFNCRNPHLQLPVVRRALNYALRKKLALDKVVAGEGELISGPIPKRNFFYNLTVPPYEDSVEKALALLELYAVWGLDLYEDDGKVIVSTNPRPLNVSQQIQANDQIIGVEMAEVQSVLDLHKALSDPAQNIFRIKLVRDQRVWVKRLQRMERPESALQSLAFKDGKIQGFPKLNLIANNPEGKIPQIKEVCGALKEDLERIGIPVVIDYLDNHEYYPRLQEGEFDLVYRTVKITGTPNLYRMFYKKESMVVPSNTNYGNYFNPEINELALATRDITDINSVKLAWKKAHEILHHDPPLIYLWSRNHIILYDPRIQILNPGLEYKVPFGYTKINGLINIFNEVHLWTWLEEKP